MKNIIIGVWVDSRGNQHLYHGKSNQVWTTFCDHRTNFPMALTNMQFSYWVESENACTPCKDELCMYIQDG